MVHLANFMAAMSLMVSTCVIFVILLFDEMWLLLKRTQRNMHLRHKLPSNGCPLCDVAISWLVQTPPLVLTLLLCAFR
jgi:hypothetical protein